MLLKIEKYNHLNLNVFFLNFIHYNNIFCSCNPPLFLFRIVFFAGINNAKFRVPVVPGDQLILETTLSNQRRNFWVFEGKASVDGKLAAQAEIKLMLQPS